MRYFEIAIPFKIFIATVRIKLNNSSSTNRTTIQAESSSSALLLLSRLYGVGNVLSLSEVVKESPKTDQIQLEQVFSAPSYPTQCAPRKIAQTLPSLPKSKRVPRAISSKPIPTQIKHKRIQDKLTKQFMRQSNFVKPTSDDIQIAKSRAETMQKRVDLEQKKANDRLLRR